MLFNDHSEFMHLYKRVVSGDCKVLLCLGLQFLREKPQEVASPKSKFSLLKRSAEELGGADPDVQLCYQIEATFMDIISSSTQALWHHRLKYGQFHWELSINYCYRNVYLGTNRALWWLISWTCCMMGIIQFEVTALKRPWIWVAWVCQLG